MRRPKNRNLNIRAGHAIHLDAAATSAGAGDGTGRAARSLLAQFASDPSRLKPQPDASDGGGGGGAGGAGGGGASGGALRCSSVFVQGPFHDPPSSGNGGHASRPAAAASASASAASSAAAAVAAASHEEKLAQVSGPRPSFPKALFDH